MTNRDNPTDASATQATPNRGARSLWLWVILAFVLLITAWALLIWIAGKNAPETVDPNAAHAASFTLNQLSG